MGKETLSIFKRHFQGNLVIKVDPLNAITCVEGRMKPSLKLVPICKKIRELSKTLVVSYVHVKKISE